jgi:DNA ligase D-like protein (predicted 3'-phosphoesterase)
MLILVLAHPGPATAPHDLWGAWNLDPAIVLGVGIAAWAYRRGGAGDRRRDVRSRRARCFAGALLALSLALVSPLDALSGALASAHMVQHVLLLLVAAPLLALSAPSSTLLRATPRVVRRVSGRWRRRLGPTLHNRGALPHPVAMWLLHVGTLWFWHAAGPYEAALESQALHVLEHAGFLVTAFLFWRIVLGGRRAGQVSNGFGVLLVFAMALQSVFLSALLTFARTPWYSGYSATTTRWQLDPLADQQLAGVLMWIPGGLVYLATALALSVNWIRGTEDVAVDSPIRAGSRRVSEAPMAKPLAAYRRKRDFRRTPEPGGGEVGVRRRESARFVVQKHAASRLHYDFRLEVDGVLKSWAVPKGPSYDPKQKRLAVATEDHPLEYQDFEGVIPEGEYGAGTVIVWDRGTYRNLSDVPMAEALAAGHAVFWLDGQKLQGGWALTRFRAGRDELWLLVKMVDEYADPRRDLTADDRSVLSGRTLAEVGASASPTPARG